MRCPEIQELEIRKHRWHSEVYCLQDVLFIKTTSHSIRDCYGLSPLKRIYYILNFHFITEASTALHQPTVFNTLSKQACGNKYTFYVRESGMEGEGGELVSDPFQR